MCHIKSGKPFEGDNGKDMNACCKVLNPVSVKSWDSFLTSHPDATFYHTQSWAKLLCETYDYEPRYFMFSTMDKLHFLLPMMEIKSLFSGRRGVSLPFTDSVLPIVSCKEERWDVWEAWEAVVAYAKKASWRYVDLHGGVNPSNKACAYESFYEHEIKLSTNTDLVFSRFKCNHKKNIKNAIRAGIEIEFRNDMESLNEFYYLNTITRKRHGVPSQPYKFFENLFKFIIHEGKGIVVLAKYQGEVVSAAIFLLFGEKAIFKYGASKKIKSLRANNLLMWETINWLSNRNYTSLNLGRTKTINVGLLRYKNGWGPEQKIINYYRYSVRDNSFVTKRNTLDPFSECFFKAAPVRVSNFLGGVLYRHVG